MHAPESEALLVHLVTNSFCPAMRDKTPRSRVPVFPIVLQGNWGGGFTIFAFPEQGSEILTYSELKKKIRFSLIASSFVSPLAPVHEQFMNDSLTPGEQGKNLPFVGGWIGFLSYDLGAQFVGVSQRTKRDLSVPEVYFVYCPKAYLIDSSGRCWFVNEGEVQVHETFMNGSLNRVCADGHAENEVRSNLAFAQYEKKLKKIKEYLLNGDTYQVNFSQRFSVPYKNNPLQLFQKISALNPSPYQFFATFPSPSLVHEQGVLSRIAGQNEFVTRCTGSASLSGACMNSSLTQERGRREEGEIAKMAVISNSPELLIKGEWKNGEMMLQTKPIKGTVPRGKTPEEDERKVRELLVSKKDEAELAMIVDLERNDLGKVSISGSVHVRDHRAIEKYSHVIHTVSTVESKLLPGKDVFDVLEAVFPGGSITGCPKKRTMEIIDQLEDFQRGIYCGSAGYISLNGNFEFNIMIRTMWHENGRIFFHSGGGIIADSDPKKEYEETLHKAKALTTSLYSATVPSL